MNVIFMKTIVIIDSASCDGQIRIRGCQWLKTKEILQSFFDQIKFSHSTVQKDRIYFDSASCFIKNIQYRIDDVINILFRHLLNSFCILFLIPISHKRGNNLLYFSFRVVTFKCIDIIKICIHYFKLVIIVKLYIRHVGIFIRCR